MEIGLHIDHGIGLIELNPPDKIDIFRNCLVEVVAQLIDSQHQIHFTKFFRFHQVLKGSFPHFLTENAVNAHAGGGEEGSPGDVSVFLKPHGAGIADEKGVIKVPFRRLGGPDQTSRRLGGGDGLRRGDRRLGGRGRFGRGLLFVIAARHTGGTEENDQCDNEKRRQLIRKFLNHKYAPKN